MIFESPSRRKNFTIKTKRIEWLKASGTTGEKILVKYLADGKVPTKMPNSKCRVCKSVLKWGDRSYDFDHKDNNPSNNNQNNCYLVCKTCHGKHTKTKVIKERGLFGEVIGHKTIKLRVGYKKQTSKKAPKKKPKKKRESIFDF